MSAANPTPPLRKKRRKRTSSRFFNARHVHSSQDTHTTHQHDPVAVVGHVEVGGPAVDRQRVGLSGVDRVSHTPRPCAEMEGGGYKWTTCGTLVDTLTT